MMAPFRRSCERRSSTASATRFGGRIAVRCVPGCAPAWQRLTISGLLYAEDRIDVATRGANRSLTLNGAAVTNEFTTGKIGGLSHARDTLIPGYLSRLDTVAYEVAQQVNTLHQTGTDLNGNAGGVFFTPPAAVAGAAFGWRSPAARTSASY